MEHVHPVGRCEATQEGQRGHFARTVHVLPDPTVEVGPRCRQHHPCQEVDVVERLWCRRCRCVGASWTFSPASLVTSSGSWTSVKPATTPTSSSVHRAARRRLGGFGPCSRRRG